jgi:hypothetical protein
MHSSEARLHLALRASSLSLKLGGLPGTGELMFLRPVHLIFAVGWNSGQGRMNRIWAKVSPSWCSPWLNEGDVSWH